MRRYPLQGSQELHRPDSAGSRCQRRRALEL